MWNKAFKLLEMRDEKGFEENIFKAFDYYQLAFKNKNENKGLLAFSLMTLGK